MAEQYDHDTMRGLHRLLNRAKLHYRRPPKRYEPGKVLEVSIHGVCPAVSGRARFRLEAFAGGGFAGQVYRATLLDLDPKELIATGLQVGNPLRSRSMFLHPDFPIGFATPSTGLDSKGRFQPRSMSMRCAAERCGRS